MKECNLEKRELNNQTLHLFKEEQLYSIFKLVYSAAPEYYQIFLSDEEDRSHFLETFRQQIVNGSELENISLYSLKNEIVGISVYYNSSLVSTKRQFSTLLLLRQSNKKDESISKLRQFDLDFSGNLVPKDAKYLSRIAIRDEFKGSGVSSNIFYDVCLDEPALAVKYLYLIVHKQNKRAIQFYNKMQMRSKHRYQNNSIYELMEGNLI